MTKPVTFHVGRRAKEMAPYFFMEAILLGRAGRAEFEANAAKIGLIERLADSRQMAKFGRKKRRIIVTRGQHARNAVVDQFGQHFEDLATAQVDIEKNTVGMMLFDSAQNVANFRNRADNLASEMMKDQFEIERDKPLIFNNKNFQARKRFVRNARFLKNPHLTVRRVHNNSSNIRGLVPDRPEHVRTSTLISDSLGDRPS